MSRVEEDIATTSITTYNTTRIFTAIMAYDTPPADSLKAAKVEHGLQTTAIYWETNLNPFNGAFGAPA